MRDPQQGVALPVSNTGLFMIGATARWIEDYDRYCGQKSRWAIFRQVRHWLVANDGNPVLIGLDIGGPANFDSIIRRLVGRFKPTRFTKSGKRAARFPPRVHVGNLAIARAVDKRKHRRKHPPHKGRTNKAS